MSNTNVNLVDRDAEKCYTGDEEGEAYAFAE